MAVAHSDLASRGEIAFKVRLILGDKVPRAVNPFAAELQSTVPAHHSLEPIFDA